MIECRSRRAAARFGRFVSEVSAAAVCLFGERTRATTSERATTCTLTTFSESKTGSPAQQSTPSSCHGGQLLLLRLRVHGYVCRSQHHPPPPERPRRGVGRLTRNSTPNSKTTGEVGIVERNCKYNRLALPGIVFMCWPFESLKSRWVQTVGLASFVASLALSI